MIVRTYGRRSRDLSRSASFSDPLLDVGSDADPDVDIDADDDFSFPFSQSQETEIQSSRDRYSLFSSQDSSLWSLDPDFPADNPRPSKRPRDASASEAQPSLAATATLMEAQEFGEMMEHVDEVYFALDGLRPGQPARIRRASLLSLLSICGSAQQRRLLRAQGMAKRIVDAILGLKFDDSPSTVAAAALFFVLASDAQDDHLLDSPTCIRFLLKLLNPPVTGIAEDRTMNIGAKFLGLRIPQMLNDTNKGTDSSSRPIFLKVQKILLSCKEIKLVTEDDDGMSRPELSSKWISLLTMEKACLSTVSFEDTSEPVRKVAGNFKERLRELGGLDAIFDIVISCHSTMERWSKCKLPSLSELKDGSTLESVMLFLKCLKIMENATFLSKDNQDHLLSMRAKLDSVGSPVSFVGVIISSIKLLSGFSLLQRFSNSTSQGRVEDKKTGNPGSTSTRDVACGENENSHAKRTTAYHKRQKLTSSTSELSISGSGLTVSFTSNQSVKNKANGHTSDLHDGALSCSTADNNKSNGLKLNRNANGLKANTSRNNLKVNSAKGACGWISIRTTVSESNSCRPCKRPHSSEEFKGESSMDCSDPFAFDEDDLEPSKWEKLSSKKETSQTLQSTVTSMEHSRGNDIFSIDADLMLNPTTNDDSRGLVPSQSIDGEISQSCDKICPLEAEEDSNLLDDCLLASVKVLMNLTNDNSVGCQQIAANGGLDTMVSLLVNHFPSYDLRSPMHSQSKEDVPSSSQSASSGRLNNKRLTDHGLDFLVAILGLLVNLVEKDSRNRLRLVVARVSVEGSGVSEAQDMNKDVIQLLCSIFLANQGAGEAAEEGRLLLLDDEALTQGEQEAEMMIIEAYAALLLAFLSTESADVREAISSCLPNHNLEALVPVLERFVAFHLTLNMISPETHSTVTKVIESCKGS